MLRGGRARSRQTMRNARPPLANYYRGQTSKSSPFQPKVQKMPRGRLVSKIVDWLIIAVVIFCLIYSLMLSPPPKIISSSNIYEPNYVYKNAAAGMMGGLADHSKLTFDETSLVSSLQKQFPEIADAEVELSLFGQKPIIRLSIAKPDFVLSSGGVRYVLASNGVAVSRADTFADDDNLPVLMDESGFQTQVGKPVFSADQTAFISTVLKQVDKAGVPVASMILPKGTAEELDLRTKDKKYFVKFYLDGDPLVETGQFLAARRQFADDHKDPSQYLDVRVAGKIFYK